MRHLTAAWSRVAAPLYETTWYRGTSVTLTPKDPRSLAVLSAIATGSRTALLDRLLVLLGGGSGTDPWTGRKNGPHAGAGVWWTSDASTARHYAGHMLYDTDGLNVGVLLEARIDPAVTDRHLPLGQQDGIAAGRIPRRTPLEVLRVTLLDAPVPAQARELVEMARERGWWNDINGQYDVDLPSPQALTYDAETQDYRLDLPRPMKTQAGLG